MTILPQRSDKQRTRPSLAWGPSLHTPLPARIIQVAACSVHARHPAPESRAPTAAASVTVGSVTLVAGGALELEAAQVLVACRVERW